MGTVVVYFHSFLTSPLERGRWSASSSGRFTHRVSLDTEEKRNFSFPSWKSNPGLQISQFKSLNRRKYVFNQKQECSPGMHYAFFVRHNNYTMKNSLLGCDTVQSGRNLRRQKKQLSWHHSPKDRIFHSVHSVYFSSVWCVKTHDACVIVKSLLNNINKPDKISTLNQKKVRYFSNTNYYLQ